MKRQDNLPLRDELIIEWDRPIRKGKWAMSTRTWARGVVAGYTNKKGVKYAKLVYTRYQPGNNKVESRVLAAVKTLVRIKTPKRVVYSQAWIWEDSLRPLKEEEMSYWCRKLQQFVGGPIVCERRCQSDLFPRCAGCTLSPLVTRDEMEEAEIEKTKTRLIFNDPPAHPVKGSKVPASSWVSGGKVIGLPYKSPDKLGLKRAKPVTTYKRKRTVAPVSKEQPTKRVYKRKKVDTISTADLIKDELKSKGK